jgi:hypothetical protein
MAEREDLHGNQGVTLTLKGEKDEESEVIRYLRRLCYMIEEAEVII